MSERQPLAHYLGLDYPYTVVPDEGSYFIEFPDLPGCMTQVEDPAEIAPMAEDIRTLWLESAYAHGTAIPEPSTSNSYSGKFVVRVPKQLHQDLAAAARQQEISLNAYVGYLLAERNVSAHLEARLAGIEAQMLTINERLPYSVQVDPHVTPLEPRSSRKERSNMSVYRKAVAA